MTIKIVHMYPDLMNLYGSYANISVLARIIERQGYSVNIQTIEPYSTPEESSRKLADADFIYMGAGTERRQLFALSDLNSNSKCLSDALRNTIDDNSVLLFVGTAAELLGQSLTNTQNETFETLCIAEFNSVQQPKRIVGDVCASCNALFSDTVVGFMNKSAKIENVTHPLFDTLKMGFGNAFLGDSEGWHDKNVYASELTGPILVKNPAFLTHIAAKVLEHKGISENQLPPNDDFDAWNVDPWAIKGYKVTVSELTKLQHK